MMLIIEGMMIIALYHDTNYCNENDHNDNDDDD